MRVLNSVMVSFAMVCLASPLCAQRTWIVSEGRFPRDFTDFPPAVAAAQPGDTILLQRGTYTSAVIDKGITVMQDSTWNSGMAIHVANVPAGQRVSLRLLIGLFPITIADCEGEVVLNRVCPNPFIAGAPSGPPTIIENCRLVTWNSEYAYDVSIRSSRVVFVGMDIQVVNSPRAALRMVDSDVTLVNTNVRSFDLLFAQPAPVPVVPAIEMTGGRLSITGLSRAWGAQVCCDYSVTPPVLSQSPAIVSNGGVVELDPRTTLIPAGGTVGTSVVSTRYVPTCTMLVPPPTVTSALFATLTATPGATVFLLASLPVGVVPSPWGAFWLDPTPGYAMVLGQGTANATGVLDLALLLTPLIPPSMVLRWQGVTVEPSGEILLTTPATSVMAVY